MSSPAPIDVDQRLVDLITAEMTESASPRIVGIAGPPGAGKSTLATALVATFSSKGVTSAVLPMDGFHLSNAQLERLGLSHCKGAASTFDPQGFISYLQRVRSGGSVYVPDYSRVLDEPVSASILIDLGTDVVITEGLYLFLNTEPWKSIKPLLDVPLFLDTNWEQCRERLLARRLAGGWPPAEALEWVDGSDLANHNTVLRDSDLEGVLLMRDGLFV